MSKGSYKQIFLLLAPYALFGVVYFLLGLYPNYKVGEVHFHEVYDLEKQLFGIDVDGRRLIPCEYFAINHWAWVDVLSGLFYLCWVPLPIFYSLWLFFTGHQKLASQLSMAFLLVNVIGFCGYYIYPSSPPWYVMEHGFEPIFSTKGSPAGFINFDMVTGIPLFQNFYSGNANVFAAVPSLHSAYNPIAFYYACKVPRNRVWQIILGVVSVGIWFSAVYSWHHYIIDVVLGVLCTCLGLIIMSKLPQKWGNK